jgi:hypothetical protein
MCLQREAFGEKGGVCESLLVGQLDKFANESRKDDSMVAGTPVRGKEGIRANWKSRQGRQKKGKKLHDSAFGIFNFRLIENWIISGKYSYRINISKSVQQARLCNVFHQSNP